MKKYIWYMWVIVIGNIIDILNKIYYILIYKFRYNARVIVYQYSNYKKQYIHNLRYKKEHNHNVVVYYFYLIVIWIWCDDNLNRDLLDTNITYDLINNNITNNDKNTILKDLNKVGSNIYKPFENIDKGSFNIKTTLTSIWLTMLHNKNNNFKWKYYYTTNKDIVFTKTIFGYKFGWELIEQRPYSVFIYKIVIATKV